MSEEPKPYILLLSVHGLVRGHDLELGRDADTGGQTQYVVELARALTERPEVGRVDLLTRRVDDPRVADDYRQPEEELAPRARIVRLPFGPEVYLRKELLWPHLDELVQAALQLFRRQGRLPDLLHSHYADAGYVAARLSEILGIPSVHTGHSLGRVKRQRLLDQGLAAEEIEATYHLERRIAAEEEVLQQTARIITSTRQEIEEQYALYDHYPPEKMVVLPPGIEVGRFHPPAEGFAAPPIWEEILRFLVEPQKPFILSIARPDPRKNLAALIEAYGETPELRDGANLLLVVGNREDIRETEESVQEVYEEMLQLIDRYDLYGKVAYPKHHRPEDVPDLYRLAAHLGGVFVNPALTEPFGLTLIEAAASGLPIVATNDGGPRDILEHCQNGLLIDPLDVEAMGTALVGALTDRERWQRWAEGGRRCVAAHYSWRAHVDGYLREIAPLFSRPRSRKAALSGHRLLHARRLLVTDLDDTLFGDVDAITAFVAWLRAHDPEVAFAIATGRELDDALTVLAAWNVPRPDILVTAVGTAIHYAPRLDADRAWERTIAWHWDRPALADALAPLPGLELQPAPQQSATKLSYFVDPERLPSIDAVHAALAERDLEAHVVYSRQRYLDLLPVRASKGRAIEFLAERWDFAPEAILVAGDSGNDADMLETPFPAVVVGNHDPDLAGLAGREGIYFATRPHAAGILEGIEHYRFLEAPLAAI